jgi:hypothetical protein
VNKKRRVRDHTTGKPIDFYERGKTRFDSIEHQSRLTVPVKGQPAVPNSSDQIAAAHSTSDGDFINTAPGTYRTRPAKGSE